jgi:cell division protein FtsW (lipid II flippase)
MMLNLNKEISSRKTDIVVGIAISGTLLVVFGFLAAVLALKGEPFKWPLIISFTNLCALLGLIWRLYRTDYSDKIGIAISGTSLVVFGFSAAVLALKGEPFKWPLIISFCSLCILLGLIWRLYRTGYFDRKKEIT